LDPGLTEFCTADVPVPELRVVRRKYGSDRFLTSRTRFFKLDLLADEVWRACDGRASVARIAEQVAASQQRPLDEALAATILALQYFQRYGLLTLRAPPV
jgi:Coenzyme PQQ synthesis protein D (PqqD)